MESGEVTVDGVPVGGMSKLMTESGSDYLL